jgi:hypothetical protein
MEDKMGDALKGFAFGFGVTAGALLGLYAGFKGIETIGYYTAKSESKKDFEARVEEELKRRALKSA